MAAAMKDPRTFFTQGSAAQYEYVLNLYESAVRLKAEQKNKKPEDWMRLERWYQVELPKKIKARGKDAHLTHEELVQCMRWKLGRGKFSPRLKDLIQMNTPRLCITETKKAFRALHKKDDLASAVQALCNLKGVGPAMASVVLTAYNPDICGFMADECLMAIPEIESIDYTTKELLNFVEQLKAAANRLNKEGKGGWNPHKVEQALWTHFVLSELKKELLEGIPSNTNIPPITENGGTALETNNQEKKNGSASPPEESNDSTTQASQEAANKGSHASANGTSSDPDASLLNEDTNDSLAVSEALSEPPGEDVSSSDVPSPTTESYDETSRSDEPSPKKIKLNDK